jgi:hypothetical protein
MNAGQAPWCSLVRLRGLLLLIDLVLRNHPSKGFSLPADLARAYISKLMGPRPEGTIREPLAVLCRVGILKRVRNGVNGWHVATPAAYVVAEAYLKRRLSLQVELPSNLARKQELALNRQENRLNRRYPFRAQLLADLAKLSFAPGCRKRVVELLHDPNFGATMKRTMEAIDGREHFVRINPRGQITTSLSSCPRELKAHLLIDGEPVALCDMSHAHHCFLPALLIGRIQHLRDKYGCAADVRFHSEELSRLISFLSEGDYYTRWCRNAQDPTERGQKKRLINMILNWPNARCERNRLYRWMRAVFPYTFGIVEDLKREDHRNISKSLQSFTALAIRGALTKAQALGIAAIPDVDSLICPERHKKVVCELIGGEVYDVSRGVCCQVAGVRYRPPPGSAQNAPEKLPKQITYGAEDRAAASKDNELLVFGMKEVRRTEWEALCRLKRQVVLHPFSSGI